jgi:hypothetical protein
MKTTEQIMASLVEELTRIATSAEDQRRLEILHRNWDFVRERREAKQLKILLLQEELRLEDERFTCMFDEWRRIGRTAWRPLKGGTPRGGSAS